MAALAAFGILAPGLVFARQRSMNSVAACLGAGAVGSGALYFVNAVSAFDANVFAQPLANLLGPWPEAVVAAGLAAGAINSLDGRVPQRDKV